MIFEYIDLDGMRYLEWCMGNVTSLPKAKGKNKNTVTVWCNEKYIKGRENETSNVILMPSLRNPKT